MLGFSPLASAPAGATSSAKTIYADGVLAAAGAELAGSSAATKVVYADGDFAAAGSILDAAASFPTIIYADGAFQAAGAELDAEATIYTIIYADGDLTAAGTNLEAEGSIRAVIYADGAIEAAGARMAAEASISKVIYGDGDFAAAGAEMDSSDLFRRIITTPRPPLNLFETVRRNTTLKVIGGWTYITQPPTYRIPDEFVDGEYTENEARYITTAFSIVAPTIASKVEVEIINFDDRVYRRISDQIDVPSGGRVDVELAKGIIDAQDVIRVRVTAGGEVDVTISYVANLREEFEVL